jgi:hypothetical protein
MENRMMDKDLEGWNTKEQEEDILDRKVGVVVVRVQQMKMSQNKLVGVGEVHRGASQVHTRHQLEVGECAHQIDHHDSHNHHNSHQTRSHKDQGKVDHTPDLEEEVYGIYHDHRVLLGVVEGCVVDQKNRGHDRVVLLFCLDLGRGMNQNVLNDHPSPWSNGQNELEEVEHG